VPQQVAGHKMASKPLLMRGKKIDSVLNRPYTSLKIVFVFFVMPDWRIFTIHLVLDHPAGGFLSALHTVLLKKIEKT
jgi:hypothetical protein